MPSRYMRRVLLVSVIFALSLSLAAGCSSPATSTPTGDSSASGSGSQAAIPWNQAGAHMGETVSVSGPVVSATYASSSKGSPTFLNVGADYPDPSRFTVVIWGDSRGAFPTPPESMYAGKTLTVSGTIESYKGVPEIIVSSPSQIAAN